MSPTKTDELSEDPKKSIIFFKGFGFGFAQPYVSGPTIISKKEWIPNFFSKISACFFGLLVHTPSLIFLLDKNKKSLNQIYKYDYQYINLFDHYFQKNIKFVIKLILIEIKDKFLDKYKWISDEEYNVTKAKVKF